MPSMRKIISAFSRVTSELPCLLAASDVTTVAVFCPLWSWAQFLTTIRTGWEGLRYWQDERLHFPLLREGTLWEPPSSLRDVYWGNFPWPGVSRRSTHIYYIGSTNKLKLKLYFRWGIAVKARIWLLTSIYCWCPECMEFYLHPPKMDYALQQLYLLHTYMHLNFSAWLTNNMSIIWRNKYRFMKQTGIL
jgi:hypothetical protein